MRFQNMQKYAGNPFVRIAFRLALFVLLAAPAPLMAQQIPFGFGTPSASSSPLTSMNTPGTEFLFALERKMAAAVAQGGGAAFASFFDSAGVTLANKQLPVIGREAIAAHARWLPNEYQLQWTPEGGALSADGSMGYTWGHYEGRSLTGAAAAQSGRYMTVWKREADGSWKILLDASNEDAAGAECKCSATP